LRLEDDSQQIFQLKQLLATLKSANESLKREKFAFTVSLQQAKAEVKSLKERVQTVKPSESKNSLFDEMAEIDPSVKENKEGSEDGEDVEEFLDPPAPLEGFLFTAEQATQIEIQEQTNQHIHRLLELQIELESTKSNLTDEKLKQHQLQEKLAEADNKYKILEDEIKKTQHLVETYKRKEEQAHLNSKEKDRQWVDKLNKWIFERDKAFIQLHEINQQKKRN